MAVFSMTSCTIGASLTWSVPATSPGDPGTQTVAGTLASSTDLTAMISEVQLSIEATELDYTNFASGGWVQIESGLAKGMVQFTFNQDFAASQTDARFGLGGTFGLRTKPYCDVKATSAARGATNPSYVFQFVNTKYQPLTGRVGDLAVIQLQFPTTGQVARLTA